MNDSKNYLTVWELQQLCDKLNLPSDGLKGELIGRIQKFVTMDDSRVTICRARIPSVPTVDRSTETVDEPSMMQSVFSFSFWCPKIVMLFGFFGGCFALFQLFLTETENIPVRRSWF